MNWRAILVLLILASPAGALANINPIASPDPSRLCRQAISAAERAHGIPSHLLAAIARVESGRRDATSGTFNPWPWTINMDGQGSFYDNKSEAVIAASSMRPRVTRSIDVGCMQISLTHHPDAFASLDQAFDPFANADYGARFLTQLYAKTSSWPRAVEMYHSATPEIGAEYGRQVYAALPDEQKLAEVAEPASPGSVWSAGISRSLLMSPLRPVAPRIIPLNAGLMGGAPPPGRSLASYRSAPVRMAFRAF